MQLRRVELTNIRSYTTAVLDLGPGTTLLVGDVGSGKTSLLYAIEMALFGVAEIEAAHLVRHGSRRSEVAVRFEDAEHRYEVGRSFRRVLRRGKEVFEPERITFLEDGRTTSYSATEIRRKVIELLGFADNPSPQARSDLWRWAIYVPQEQMRAILGARPEERLETVRKALAVERYRLAADNAEVVARDLRIGAGHYREEATRLAHWAPELAAATEEAARLERSRGDLVRACEHGGAVVATSRARRATVDLKVRAVEAAERDLEALDRERIREDADLADHRRHSSVRQEAIARLETDLRAAATQANDVELLTSRVTVAETALNTARSAVNELSEELRRSGGAKAEAVAAEKILGERRAELRLRREEADAAGRALEEALAAGPAREPPAPTPSSLEELDGRIAEVRADERTATERAIAARRALAQIDELLGAGVCPTCHQTVEAGAFRRHRSEAETRVAAEAGAEETVRRTIQRLEEERRARERYERSLERWRSVEKSRGVQREAVARTQESVGRTERAEAAAVAHLAALQAALEGFAGLDAREARVRADLTVAESELATRRTAAERARLGLERQQAGERALRLQLAERDRELREIALAEDRQRQRQERRGALATAADARAQVEQEVREAQEGLDRAEEALRAAREGLARTEERLAAEQRRLATAAEGRDRAASLGEAAAALEAKATWLTGPFRVHVMAMEQRILARARAVFDREFARYFAALVDDPALVARTDAAFTPEVALEGEPTPAEALSGGERTSLALAFRLALSTVVRTLGNVRLATVLLDEPTDGFSAEQVVRMGELLEELDLPQVVVVSHEPQLAAIADRVVRVQKRDGASVLEGGGRAESSLPPPAERPRARWGSLDETPPGSPAT